MIWWNKPVDVLKYSVVFLMVFVAPFTAFSNFSDTNTVSALAQIPLYSNKTEPYGAGFEPKPGNSRA